MTERLHAELDLIRTRFPELEYREQDRWARIPVYPVPDGWNVRQAEVAFQMPPEVPGQKPYGFWVRPLLVLASGGALTNTSGPVATAFGDGWQQFSWDVEPWQPGATPGEGTNMLDWALSFSIRLGELN